LLSPREDSSLVAEQFAQEQALVKGHAAELCDAFLEPVAAVDCRREEAALLASTTFVEETFHVAAMTFTRAKNYPARPSKNQSIVAIVRTCPHV
jgi:hypothetical protein